MTYLFIWFWPCCCSRAMSTNRKEGFRKERVKQEKTMLQKHSLYSNSLSVEGLWGDCYITEPRRWKVVGQRIVDSIHGHFDMKQVNTGVTNLNRIISVSINTCLLLIGKASSMSINLQAFVTHKVWRHG